MENLSFVAIDFETATSQKNSICEIGIAVVKNAQLVENKSWLVKPVGNRYDTINKCIHGITEHDTANAPSFAEVWNEVKEYLDGNVVVAHNVSFDMYALRDALIENGIEFPSFQFYCSCRTAKYVFHDTYSYSLPVLCHAMGIDFGAHHRAEGDAIGCAKVFAKSVELAGVDSLEELQNKYGFRCGEFKTGYFTSQKSLSSGSSSKLKVSDIVGDPDKVDEGNYFYGKSVCFTGACQYGTRKDMLQRVADVGGVPTNSVTKSTDVLVVGQQDYRVVGESGMSSKQVKAMSLKDGGSDIEILSEVEFISMI